MLKRMKATDCLLFLVLASAVIPSLGLQCWKCIAKDCDLRPEHSSKTSVMTCLQGESCMKVRYRMDDDHESVVRTCSAGPCRPLTSDDFRNCTNTPRKYSIIGCTLRTCCNDRNLCNDASTSTPSPSSVYFLHVLVSLCYSGLQAFVG